MNTALQALPTYIQEKVSTATVPVKYSAAVKALAECRNIDDAKYFSDKADALAAWAKIYKNDEAAVEAKRLKLHAFRRMGVLASALRPGGGLGPHKGRGPGPRSLLMEHGLNRSKCDSVMRAASAPKKVFRKAVMSSSPPSPNGFKLSQIGRSNAWKSLCGYRVEGVSGGLSISNIRCFCRKLDPKEIARGLTPSEAKRAGEIATEIIEWMDTFDQYLPKAK